jgi:di/tricarboxylate transporter
MVWIKRRRRDAPDRFVNLKVGIFFLAAGLWVAGVVANLEWLTGAAILVLVVGFVLRVLASRAEERAALDDEREDGEEEDLPEEHHS